MKQGNAVTTAATTAVNYGDGFGTFGVIARKAQEKGVAFNPGIDVPLFSPEMSKFGAIGVKSTFTFAAVTPVENEEVLVNTADGVNNNFNALT